MKVGVVEGVKVGVVEGEYGLGYNYGGGGI